MSERKLRANFIVEVRLFNLILDQKVKALNFSLKCVSKALVCPAFGVVTAAALLWSSITRIFC